MSTKPKCCFVIWQQRHSTAISYKFAIREEFNDLSRDECTTGLASALHLQDRPHGKQAKGESRMFSIMSFVRKWKQWYSVLRYRKGFGRLDSVRFGLWLARG